MQRISRQLPTVMGVAFVLVVLTAANAPAQSPKKIVVLGGESSAVVSGIAKSRSRKEARQMMRSARERKAKLKMAEEEREETKKHLKAQLADVDAVAVDASTAGTSEDDRLLVESALEAGVPVVLENADSKKMAQLTGAVGVDSKTVVIETTEGGGQFHITIVDGPEPTIESGPTQTVELSDKPVAEDPKLKEALTQYEAKQKANMPLAPKEGATPAAARPTSAQKAALVETIISEKAFKKGVRRHALITGTCSDGKKCKEGQVTRSPVLQFCPGNSCSANSSLTPVLEWGVYKTVSQDPTTSKPRNSAYIIARAAGRPNLAMMWDATQNRGYYLDSWSIKFDATFPANMQWVLDKASPDNANKQSTVTYTTGFSVTGSTPNAIGIGYNASTARTMTTEEFGITRTNTATSTTGSVTWTTKMQMDGQGRAYTGPADLFIRWVMSTTDVALLPTISKLGTDFRAEAVWSGYRDAACGQCIVKVTGTFSLQMYRAWAEQRRESMGLEKPKVYWARNSAPYSLSLSLPPIEFTTNW